MGLSYMPEERSLGALCAEVGQQRGKRGDAIYKALTRTVHDIWENGDRQELDRLMGYRQAAEPSAKEMVTALIRTLWNRDAQVEYRLQEGGVEQKVGIRCRVMSEGFCIIMPPFSRDRAAVLRLIERWNREQLPVQQFRDMILLGQLREKE